MSLFDTVYTVKFKIVYKIGDLLEIVSVPTVDVV
jgi:hypothetical protein